MPEINVFKKAFPVGHKGAMGFDGVFLARPPGLKMGNMPAENDPAVFGRFDATVEFEPCEVVCEVLRSLDPDEADPVPTSADGWIPVIGMEDN